MKLIEMDGKRVISNAGVAIPPALFIARGETWPEGLNWECSRFLKAQVGSGRRGKSGLVRSVSSQKEADEARGAIEAQLGGTPCAGFLLEEAIPHRDEWFVSVTLDRHAGAYRVAVSSVGGMDVARAISLVVHSEADCDMIDAPSSVKEVCVRLWRACVRGDVLHLEINPLVILDDGSAVALDAKVECDDAALFRHPEWQTFHSLPPFTRPLTPREVAYQTFLNEAHHRGTLGRYVELDGDVAMMLFGGGASLVAMDALCAAGGRPANYVEVSGNPEAGAVRRAAEIVFSRPGLRAVWIAGSFANFTDIDATVAPILDAYVASGLRIPLVIRRDGPHADDAEARVRTWAYEQHVQAQFHRSSVSLDASARALVTLFSYDIQPI